MSTICIYHADCTDGFSSAWVFRNAFKYKRNVIYHPSHHHDELPITNKTDDIFIVDFSYSYDKMITLINNSKSVTVK